MKDEIGKNLLNTEFIIPPTQAVQELPFITYHQVLGGHAQPGHQPHPLQPLGQRLVLQPKTEPIGKWLKGEFYVNSISRFK